MKSVLKRAVTVVASVMALCATSVMALEPGYRAPDPQNTLVIETTKGVVVVELYPQLAPVHVERVITLTRQGFYDGIEFDRVLEGFMAQLGQRSTKGSGLESMKGEFTVRHDGSLPIYAVRRQAGNDQGFLGAMPVQTQPTALTAITQDGKVEAWGLFCEGVVGMARTDDPNSANSGFFLTRGTSAFLDKNYTAFGVVIGGRDVVRRFKIGEPPVDADKVTKMRVLADIPEAERPQVEVMDTASPQFKTFLDSERRRNGDQFFLCDITVPTKMTAAASVQAAEAAPQQTEAAPSE